MEKLLKNSKGQVQSIAPAIITLIFATVVLIFGIIAIDVLRSTTATETGAGNNVTITMNVTNPRIPTSNFSQCGFKNFAISYVSLVNQTAGAGIISSGNYSGESLTGIINVTDADPSGFKNIAWNVTYTYNYGSGEACIAANQTIAGLATFGDFWEIIILAIVISVVIGLLLVVFGRQSRR